MNSKGNLSKYGENTFIGESLKEILGPMKEETTKQHPWALPMIELVDPDREDWKQTEEQFVEKVKQMPKSNNLFGNNKKSKDKHEYETTTACITVGQQILMTLKESLADDEWLKLRMEKLLDVNDIDILFVLHNSIETTARSIYQAVHTIIEAWKGPGNDRSIMFKYSNKVQAEADAWKLDLRAESGAADLYKKLRHTHNRLRYIGINAPDLLTTNKLFLKFDNPFLQNVKDLAPKDEEPVKDYAIRVDEKLRDIKPSHGLYKTIDTDSVVPQANAAIAEGNKEETKEEIETVEARKFNKSTQNSQFPCTICGDKSTRPHALRNCFYNPDSDKWNVDLQKEDQKRRREAASAKRGRKRQKKENA